MNKEINFSGDLEEELALAEIWAHFTLHNRYIACPDGGAGNDPEALSLVQALLKGLKQSTNRLGGDLGSSCFTYS